MTLLAAARDLPQDVILASKSRSGRPIKATKHTDDVRRQSLRRNPHLSASKSKKMHQDHFEHVSIRCIEHRSKKDLMIPNQRAASKTFLTPRMRKKRLQFAFRYLH